MLTLLFGLDGQGKKSLEQIGERLGFTRQRVDKIVKQVPGRLRE